MRGSHGPAPFPNPRKRPSSSARSNPQVHETSLLPSDTSNASLAFPPQPDGAVLAVQLSVTSPSGLVSSSRPLHVLIDASPPEGALELHGCTPGSTLWRRVLPVRPPPTVPVPTTHLESSHVMCGLGCPGR